MVRVLVPLEISLASEAFPTTIEARTHGGFGMYREMLAVHDSVAFQYISRLGRLTLIVIDFAQAVDSMDSSSFRCSGLVLLSECSAGIGLADLCILGTWDLRIVAAKEEYFLLETILLTLQRFDPHRLRQGDDAGLVSKARCREQVPESVSVGDNWHLYLQRASANSNARCAFSKDVLTVGPCRRTSGEVLQDSPRSRRR